jgi:hypothetical protein
LAKKVTLALTSDPFKFSSSKGQNLTFWTFQGSTPSLRGRTDKLTKSSETTVQTNGLKECNSLQAVRVPQLLRETSGIQPPVTARKDYTNEGTSPDPDGVNDARPLKVIKAKRCSLKMGALTHVL